MENKVIIEDIPPNEVAVNTVIRFEIGDTIFRCSISDEVPGRLQVRKITKNSIDGNLRVEPVASNAINLF